MNQIVLALLSGCPDSGRLSVSHNKVLTLCHKASHLPFLFCDCFCSMTQLRRNSPFCFLSLSGLYFFYLVVADLTVATNKNVRSAAGWIVTSPLSRTGKSVFRSQSMDSTHVLMCTSKTLAAKPLLNRRKNAPQKTGFQEVTNKNSKLLVSNPENYQIIRSSHVLGGP